MTGPYQRSEIGLVTTSLLVPLLVLLFVSRIGSPYDMMAAAERKEYTVFQNQFRPHCPWEYFRVGAPLLPLFKVDRSGPPH